MSTVDAPARSGRDALRAAFWMAGTLAMISLLAVAGRETMRTLPTMEMIFYRSWMSLPIVLLIVLMTGQKLSVLGTRRLGMHAWRNAAHLAGQQGLGVGDVERRDRRAR